jgi:hypothetical protein
VSARERERGRKLSWRTGGVVFIGYLALAAVLLGRGAFRHFDTYCICTEASDPTQFVWTNVWWPHAIGSGINPFLTHAIWTPGPFDLATATSIPLASLAVAPVTFTLGPLAAYNVLALLSPALAAFFAFRLCRYVTGRFAPSLVAGFLFGFSGYMLGQLIGHLNLTLIFFVPLALDIVLRHLDGVTGRRRFVVSFAAVVAGQALLSTEVLFTGLMFGAIALLAAAAFFDSEGRERIRRVTISIVIGGAVAAVVISPFLYYALFYSAQPAFISAARFGMDALNPLVPTPAQWIGHSSFESVAATFPGGFTEAGGYLGIAFVLLGGWWLISTRKDRATRVMLAVLTCTVIASLGTSLIIAGQTTISLPWKLLDHLPLLEEVIPVRFAMYTSLIIALAVALALASSRGAAAWRWALASIGVLMLIPNGGSALFHSTPPDPAFFTSGQYKHYIDRDEVVLALPFSQRGPTLIWQARTDMYFRLAGGYFGQQPPDDYLEEPVVVELIQGVVSEGTPCNLKSFIERRDVGAVVLETGSAEPYRPVLAELGLRSREVGGVDLYDVTPTLATPPACT